MLQATFDGWSSALYNCDFYKLSIRTIYTATEVWIGSVDQLSQLLDVCVNEYLFNRFDKNIIA